MKSKTSLLRLNALATALERNMKAFRAEIASLTDIAPDERETCETIEAGLTSLLRSGTAFQPQVTESYKPFFPKVWTSLPSEDGMFATVQSLSYGPRNETGSGAGSRLRVTPTFSTDAGAAWFTLEMACDLAQFVSADSVRCDINCHFSVSHGNRFPLPRTHKFILRAFSDGKSADFFEYSLPLTTVPTNHSVTISQARKREYRLNDCTQIVIIISLPPVGDYAFYCDDFELRAIKA